MSGGLISAAKLLPVPLRHRNQSCLKKVGVRQRKKQKTPPPISANPDPWVMCCSQGVKALPDHQPDASSSYISDGQQVSPDSLF